MSTNKFMEVQQDKSQQV